jgi:hypothetical protein
VIFIGGITVNERDGLGISNEDSFTITAESAEAEILLMEVPMKTISNFRESQNKLLCQQQNG